MAQTPFSPRLNIHPGDWYVGTKYHSIYTVLGSCVSLTAWHPVLKVGGMCHFILPVVPNCMIDQSEMPGRYGNTALPLMKKALLKCAALHEFQLGIYGGSDTISHFDIGKKNISFVTSWVASENLKASHIDTGGKISRSLILSLSSGIVAVKHYEMQPHIAIPTVPSQKRP